MPEARGASPAPGRLQDAAAAPSRLAPGEHRGTRAIQRLVEFAPSTGGLALWVRHHDLAAEDEADEKADEEAEALNDLRDLRDRRAQRDRPQPPEAQDTPVWTDGQTLHYRAAFSALPLAEQAGWVAHQVLHIALRHPQRYLQMQQRLGDVDLRLFNTCADAIVNSALSHLGWLSLPEGAVTLPPLLAATLALEQNTETALASWDIESLYRAMDDRRGPSRGARDSSADGRQDSRSESRRDGPRAARTRAFGGRGQQDLRPQAGAQSAPEQEAEQARDWGERLQRAHAGDGEHSLLRGLLADFPKSRTPWEQLLRTQVARALAQQPDVSWSRPSRSYLANQGRIRSGSPGLKSPPRQAIAGAGSGLGGALAMGAITAGSATAAAAATGSTGVMGPGRAAGAAGAASKRMPWEPGRTATRAVPRLVLVVDVSGSIDSELMQRFGREIEALTRRLAASLVLVIGDDHVQEVLVHRPGRGAVADLLKLLRFEGGGTDFTPLLTEAAEHRPDLIVVLTDLDGPARLRPSCPVLWAVPEAHAAALAPFGRKLVLA